MFESFFPKPKLFFLSFAVWSIICILFWFLVGKNIGNQFSIGSIFGAGFPPDVSNSATTFESTSNSADKELASTFWFYQFLVFCYAIFLCIWHWYAPHKWGKWSLFGSALILFVTWFQVQLDVRINEWFGSFYDMIQKALATPNSITSQEYYDQLWTFLSIAMVFITTAVLSRFFVSHFIFRWRTAMNDYYMSKWNQVRHVEGASQRVQEDTMRFASIMENLGVSLIDAAMTLIAFLPILWALSAHITELPIVGNIAQPLVIVAIIWSVFGTALLALVGIRLPGLEFRNQRVEAAYRKELVYGEDNEQRAKPPTIAQLFDDVRKNYFRLYFNYLYFNIARYGYLQIGVLVPYIAFAPTIVAGAVSLGVLQQTIRAFGRVEGSFQYLVNSWPTIVELLSIYKRLKAFEAAINNQPLPEIDQSYLDSS